jgi:flagellar assembly protein FliH
VNAPAKFLFDTDFGRNTRAGPVSAAQHQTAVVEAEARGFRLGLASGRDEAARSLAAALARAAEGLSKLATQLPSIEERLETEAVNVALAVARKLAPELIACEPLAETVALASECFRSLVGAPHVVIRVNEALYETAATKLQEIASECGFAGRLVVLGVPDIAPGDCRIEWADGGVVRQRAAVEAAVAEAVDRYLAGRRNDGPGTPAQEGIPQ